MGTDTKRRSKLGLILTVVFFAAMLMGPGPGLRLINPDIEDPNATFVVFGLPIVYLWGIVWYVVLVAIVCVAYFTVWADECKDESSSGGDDA